MSSLKYSRAGVIVSHRPAQEALRLLVAAALRCASATLARLSRRMARPVARISHDQAELEFYSEAGAPEGALYLDGRLVGFISGVRRL
jgi:hypothetical protein